MTEPRSERFILRSAKGVVIDNSKASGDPIFGIRRSGLQKPVTPSKVLAAITGSDPISRSQIVSKVWDHIRKNNLQNPGNKREIVADDKLRAVFGKDRVSMFEMNKHISRHLEDTPKGVRIPAKRRA
ncbi:MAG: SWIB/MDM2 domain-containing protein [Sphingosinicella sp.]